MRLFAFSLLLIILIGFSAAIATVIFHFKKYAVPDDMTPIILQTFIVGTVIFLIATLFLFLAIPWETFPSVSLFS